MIKAEDLKVGSILKKNSVLIKILAKIDLIFFTSHSDNFEKAYSFYTIEELNDYGYTLEVPQVAKDLTMEEVKEHLFEEVWMWDDEPKRACRIKLCGYYGGDEVPYLGSTSWFAHASLIKPEA